VLLLTCWACSLRSLKSASAHDRCAQLGESTLALVGLLLYQRLQCWGTLPMHSHPSSAACWHLVTGCQPGHSSSPNSPCSTSLLNAVALPDCCCCH
jgi:hypothetical protein